MDGCFATLLDMLIRTHVLCGLLRLWVVSKLATAATYPPMHSSFAVFWFLSHLAIPSSMVLGFLGM